MSDTKKSNGLSLIAMILSLLTVILATWALFAAHGNRPPPPRTGEWTTLTRPMAFDAEAREATRDFIATQVEHQTAGAQSNMGTFTSAVMTFVSILVTVSLSIIGFTWWRQSREFEQVVSKAQEAKKQAETEARAVKRIRNQSEAFLKQMKSEREATQKAAGKGDARRLFMEALHYQEKGKNNTAIELYTKAIELEPTFAEAYNNRGWSYMEVGELAKAREDFDKAIEHNANVAEFYSNRGLLWMKTGDSEEAVSDFNDSIKLQPEAASYNNRAFVLAKLEKSDKAIDGYKKAIELKPDYADAYLNLAELLITVRRFGDAATCLEGGLRNVPEMTNRDRLDVAYLKAMALILGRKDARKAVTEINKLLKSGVRLTGWNFEQMNAFLGKARAKQFKAGALARARALHKKVKVASQK